MVRHRFTPAQANATLPLVKRIVNDILVRGREMQRLAPEVAKAEVAAHMGRVEGEMIGLLRELESIGCTYKDWGHQFGLVDFPGEIDGAAVLLCWRSDEDSVRWFHPPEAGFAGRLPIPESPQVEP